MACIRYLAGSLIIAVAIGHVSAAEESGAVRRISVSGTVETQTAPDQIAWHIGLRATDKDLQTAKRRNDEKVKAVLALREKLKLGEGDLQTSHVNIRREYEQGPRGDRGDFKHFVVERSIIIRQRDLKRFDDFLNALVSSADMEVSYNLESSRAQELRAQARLKALQVAREKAAAMAGALGTSLGRVLSIDENAPRGSSPSPWSNTLVTESTPTVDQGSETFVPGAISVRATVYVTFEIK